jgi:hypothetical protein
MAMTITMLNLVCSESFDMFLWLPRVSQAILGGKVASHPHHRANIRQICAFWKALIMPNSNLFITNMKMKKIIFHFYTVLVWRPT